MNRRYRLYQTLVLGLCISGATQALALSRLDDRTDEDMVPTVRHAFMKKTDTQEPNVIESRQVEKKVSLRQAFAQASKRMDVPMDLLLAISWAETRWDNRDGVPSALGGYGLMHLSEHEDAPNGLNKAAELTGLDVDQIKHNDRANILGAAAILKALADEAGMSLAERETVESWYPVVIRYCGIEDEYFARDHADQVFLFLRQGVSDTSNSGEALSITGREIEPVKGRYAYLPERSFDVPDPMEFANTRTFTNGLERSIPFPSMKWVSAHSCRYRVADRFNDQTVDRVVIHDMEGYYSSTISMFTRYEPVSSKRGSAHFCIRSSDGEITQMVATKDIAYHAINWNGRSIGIEHEGFISSPSKWFTDAMYRSSARLVAAICDKYNIPIDRTHIVGHGEAVKLGAGGDHTDPGSGWNWDKYMSYIREYAGQTPAETISTPSILSGASTSTVGSSYTITFGGAASNLGHALQYYVEWGDGSTWLGTGASSATKIMQYAQTYNIRVKARCAQHPDVISDWSTIKAVTVSPAVPLVNIVLDNASSSDFFASDNWRLSSYSAAKYGSNYRYAAPAAVSDGAYYTVNLPRAGNYEISAWYPANMGYNPSTPFVIFTASGRKTITVNQQTNGGKWNVLGTFFFNAGSQQILAVSRWSASPGYVIADAIRVVSK